MCKSNIFLLHHQISRLKLAFFASQLLLQPITQSQININNTSIVIGLKPQNFSPTFLSPLSSMYHTLTISLQSITRIPIFFTPFQFLGSVINLATFRTQNVKYYEICTILGQNQRRQWIFLHIWVRNIIFASNKDQKV